MYVCFESMSMTSFLLRDMFFTCFASFYYLVIHSILFHYIHAFIWILGTPLIIFVSRVKLYSLLYPLSIMTKRERNCGEYVVSFLTILHVRGRNTFFYKGEMCFILLGGELTSFFLYTGLLTMFTYIVLIFDIFMMMYVFFTYLYMCCFFSIFMHMLLIYCMQSIISISH